MSVRQGNKVIAGHINYHPDLFDHKWADHLLNDVSWLRGDTFSWQDGGVYEAAYNHLVDDIDGKSLTSETIGTTTIQFYLADDGHKICPASEASNVADIFTATGVAWYYILDTVNERFKLPRTKFGFNGLRDTVGNYVEAGAPNIYYSNGGLTSDPTIDGALQQISRWDLIQTEKSQSGRFIASYSFSATRCSDVYGNSDTIQPPATQMYLYFYVGNFTQTALENTAGLNASLFNGKVDIDASNFDATGKSTIANLAMPSNSYENISTSTTQFLFTDYQVPANGYIAIQTKLSAVDACMYVNVGSASPALNNVVYVDGGVYSATRTDCLAVVPVKKGQFVTCGTNSGVTFSTINFARFIYAEGEI